MPSPVMSPTTGAPDGVAEPLMHVVEPGTVGAAEDVDRLTQLESDDVRDAVAVHIGDGRGTEQTFDRSDELGCHVAVEDGGGIPALERKRASRPPVLATMTSSTPSRFTSAMTGEAWVAPWPVWRFAPPGSTVIVRPVAVSYTLTRLFMPPVTISGCPSPVTSAPPVS
ncbi:MAG: hypothetical protein R2697_08005 [Ilumatobacteraceae bacterium]